MNVAKLYGIIPWEEIRPLLEKHCKNRIEKCPKCGAKVIYEEENN